MGAVLSNRLADLAERIGEAARRGKAHKLARLSAHIEAGELLREARAECRHGEWGAVLARAGLHERTARNWMRLAATGLKPETVSDLGGMKATLAALAREGKSATVAARLNPAKLAAALDQFATERIAAVAAEGRGRVAVRRELFMDAVARLRAERARRRAAGLPCGKGALLDLRIAAGDARLALIREQCAVCAADTKAVREAAELLEAEARALAEDD